MAYQSLYRRRRPQTFGDMIGQEHITRTLGNALQHERLAHAYLFSGPRGTGKTTAAKIFARAMNCVEYPTIEPCGKCNSCKNIAAGVSIDVIEMDAASNRGIDEIRELRERTRFASGESRFKVYIIDEAHMLTPEACNAFLKTLEEPPRGVVFILATTDPSRLPSTIVSRCQRFDFHLLTAEQIRNRLDLIIEEEGWQAEDEALALISRLAEGSMRDALGILEQCSAYGDEAITAEHVRTVTGATRTEAIGALIEAAIDNDLDRGLTELHQVVYSGRDLNLFMRDLTYAFSRLLMAGGKAQEQVSEDHHEFARLTGQYGGKIERSRLLDLIELLHEAGGDLRHAHFPQYILEITFIRLLRLLHGRLKPAEPLHVEEFAAAESAVKATDTKKPGLPLAKEAVEAEKKAAAGSEQDKADQPPAELSEPREEPLPMAKKLAALREAWPRLLGELKKRQKTTAAWLEPAALTDWRGNLVEFTYSPEYQIHQERLMSDNHRRLVESVLSSFCREQIEIRAIIGETGGNVPQAPEPELQEEVWDDRAGLEADLKPASPSAEKQERPAEKKSKAPSVEEAQQLFGGIVIDNEQEEAE